jgi:hypothetical protein
MTDLFLTGLIYYWGLTFHFAAPAALKAAAAGTNRLAMPKTLQPGASLGRES